MDKDELNQLISNDELRLTIILPYFLPHSLDGKNIPFSKMEDIIKDIFDQFGFSNIPSYSCLKQFEEKQILQADGYEIKRKEEVFIPETISLEVLSSELKRYFKYVLSTEY